MSTPLTVNGIVYNYPTAGQAPGWGAVATNWAIAVTNGMLQKSGGTFALTAEANFGQNFGLRTIWLRIRNVADTFYAGFKGTNLTASVDYELPPDAGAANTFLTSNGAGVLSWSGSPANTNGGVSIQDDSPSDMAIAAGFTTVAPYLDVLNTHTYDVSGQLIGVSVDVEAGGAINVLLGGTFIVL